MLNYLLMDKDLDELSLIIRLGERYFDCSLSDAEEELLRDMLGRTRLSHPAIDELRALTGFRTNVGLRSSERRLKGRVRLVSGVAAACVVIFSLGLYTTVTRRASAISAPADVTTCVAYAGGKRITDQEAIIRLLVEDMREFTRDVRASEESFSEELSDVARIIDNIENEYPEI